MEPVSASLLILSLFIQVERVTRSLIQFKGKSKQDKHALSETRVLRETLLEARDLAEQLSTEEAKFSYLVLLQTEGRRLEILLNELEIRASRLNSKPSLNPKDKARFTQLIEECEESRQALNEILPSLELQRSTNSPGINPQQIPSRPSAKSVAEWLRGSDFTKALQVLEKQYISGTGTWLLKDPLFCQWLQEPGKSIWCTGQPGTGKSFLCAMTIGHIRKSLAMDNTPVICAFFGFDDIPKNVADIIKSMLFQLLQLTQNVSDVLGQIYNKHKLLSTYPSLKELWACLSSTMSSFDRVFIVIDALDEYLHGPEGFLNDFKSLLEIPNVSLFVTSRPTFRNKMALRDFGVIEIRARDFDIEEYVRKRLSESWLAQHQDLHDDIVRRTIQQSSGMFLHAKLYMDFLLSGSTPRDLWNGLSIQTTSHELYRSWIQHVIIDGGHQSTLTLEILVWLTYSLRPLTITELQSALGIQFGTEDFDPDNLPFIEAVKDVCSGVIDFTDTSRQQLSFVHYSLNEYFQQFLPTIMPLLPGLDGPDAFIAKKCLTCLRWRAFSRDVPFEPKELEDRLTQYPILSYAAGYWGEHAQRATPQLAIDDMMGLFNSSHNTLSSGLAMTTREQYPIHYEQAYRGMLSLHISVYFGLTDVARQILVDRNVHPDATTAGGWTALHWAARRGQALMVSLLLSYSATPSKVTRADVWTPLHLAAKEGQVDIVLKLIDANVNLDAKDVNGRTALYLAAWGGHRDIVHHLLEASADPGIPNAYGATALHCAAKRGHELVVSELLLKNIDPNVVDNCGVTALDEAVRKQHKTIVSMLSEVQAQTGRDLDDLPDRSVIHDLNWDAYTVNIERTARIQKGSQCTCHVLERNSGLESFTSPAMVFRKTFSLSSETQKFVKKYLESERTIMHRLRHPNIVAYLDFDEDPEQNASLLYMEYCDLGDLKTCHERLPKIASDDHDKWDIENEDGDDYGFYTAQASLMGETTALDSQSTWSLIAQLSLALAYLHYGLTVNLREGDWGASFETSWHNVLHRDIKPANVVVQSCESDGRIFKLCDLGIATEAGKGSEHNTTQFVGSLAFWPPEVSSGQLWSTKGDVWSLGETIRELKKLKDVKLEASLQRIVDKCTRRNQNKRPSSLEMLEEARDVLESNQLMVILPVSTRLHIQAVHDLLGGCEGGYLLQAFNLVAKLLDDIVPFHNQLAKDRRKEVIERLYLLWNDGVERCFQENYDEFSLHILVLLPLSAKARSVHISNVIGSASSNTRWERSRWTPLHLAAQEGNEGMVKDLLCHGADKAKEDVHGCTPGYYAKTFPSIAVLLQD